MLRYGGAMLLSSLALAGCVPPPQAETLNYVICNDDGSDPSCGDNVVIVIDDCDGDNCTI